jgi:hypothetical protein
MCQDHGATRSGVRGVAIFCGGGYDMGGSAFYGMEASWTAIN